MWYSRSRDSSLTSSLSVDAVTAALELFRLDMGSLKAANSTPLAWVDVEKTPFSSGYQPVMALAQNHIHFLDVPGTAVGDVNIFVIHCKSMLKDSFWTLTRSCCQTITSSLIRNHSQHPRALSLQPMARPHLSFWTPGYAPNYSHCSIINKFHPTNQVQEAFAFIPSDGSATYVLSVDTNTTQILAGPTTKDAAATYYASTNSLVQLDSKGDVSYLPFDPNDTTANAAAQWSKVLSLATSAPPSTGSSSSSATSSGSPKSSPSVGSSKSSNTNGASALAPRSIIGAILGAAFVGVGALLI